MSRPKLNHITLKYLKEKNPILHVEEIPNRQYRKYNNFPSNYWIVLK